MQQNRADDLSTCEIARQLADAAVRGLGWLQSRCAPVGSTDFTEHSGQTRGRLREREPAPGRTEPCGPRQPCGWSTIGALTQLLVFGEAMGAVMPSAATLLPHS
ncbi:hypothetical protein GCM10009854_37860 [Saccharopolyspora halophila]|uniref:Uncharacterized protein n=1 Tax=Saccharopolyspora halophila TaxID=405551 RepID=A0ABN3GN23_9PSEU